MKVLALCCTYGRHECLEKSVRMFLEQDYKGKSMLFIFNDGEEQQLSHSLIESLFKDKNKYIQLINSPKNSFNSVGEKFTAALMSALNFFTPDIVTHWDDDDIFLPNHITEGVVGMTRAYAQNMIAYKPAKSYYRDYNTIQLLSNTFEPSIFVDARYLFREKYAPVSISYHQQWLDKAIDNALILIDDIGIPTLVYNWGLEVPVYKISGNGDDSVNNMNQHHKRSTDEGDGIITPCSREEIQKFYDEIKNVKF